MQKVGRGEGVGAVGSVSKAFVCCNESERTEILCEEKDLTEEVASDFE